MIEDKRLIWRLRAGSRDALQRVYEKYEEYMLSLATGLLGNTSDAEDVVHDVFVAFAQSANRIRLRGSLKAYLGVCVANKVRDRFRARQRHPTTSIEGLEPVSEEACRPDFSAIRNEESRRLGAALACLAYEQREVVLLRLRGGLRFRTIAELQQVSINTAKGRYRYGLDKLRLLLNREIQT